MRLLAALASTDLPHITTLFDYGGMAVVVWLLFKQLNQRDVSEGKITAQLLQNHLDSNQTLLNSVMDHNARYMERIAQAINEHSEIVSQAVTSQAKLLERQQRMLEEQANLLSQLSERFDQLERAVPRDRS